MIVRGSFFCGSCDYSSRKWFGRCPECGAWGAPVEEVPDSTRGGPDRPAEVVPFTAIRSADALRLSSGIGEFDRVLGGGLVPGGVVLVAGEPGIGKSTLLLQAASAFADGGHRVFYVSAEESPSQLRLRGDRLGVESADLLVVADTRVEAMIRAAAGDGADLVIVDSIQAVHCAALDSPPGSVTQVRETALRIAEWARSSATPALLVGHVTKEGSIAGPRTLEHLVDTVIHFEGDRHHDHRILRALKNRFGPSNELGVFRMRDRGLVEVENPSELLLSERPASRPGSAVLAAIEGTRPLLVEIQALVGPPVQGSPRRTILGADFNRVAMILAVLQRRTGLDLASRDVFVNVTGGLSVVEPAADLAVASAVTSGALQRPLPPSCALFGEIGLTGELRAVSGVEARLREAARLGFDRAVMPSAGPDRTNAAGMDAVAVADVDQALKVLLGERVEAS